MGKCFYNNGDFYAGSWVNDKMDTTSAPMHNGVYRDSILIENDGASRYIG